MLIWRKREEDREFRLKSWEFVLGRMPVTVTMDLLYKNFFASDYSGCLIHMDSLDRDRFDEIISEWAELLCPGDEAAFQKEFCLQAIEQRTAVGEREIRLLTGQPPKQILVRAKLISVLGELYVEFTFERA